MLDKVNQDLPHWEGSISRIKAEQILAGQPVGAFVFRQPDQLSGWMTQGLAKENHEALQSYLLTVVEPQKKMVDYWVIHTVDGWTFYQDNPNLHDRQYQFYPDISALLDSVREMAAKSLRNYKNS
ncbi:MAG: SH2 domain-containing protein [Chlamydiales bacterium]|nr:SH2 domain-containing protein [Chlamydiales bacterium]